MITMKTTNAQQTDQKTSKTVSKWIITTTIQLDKDYSLIPRLSQSPCRRRRGRRGGEPRLAGLEHSPHMALFHLVTGQKVQDSCFCAYHLPLNI